MSSAAFVQLLRLSVVLCLLGFFSKLSAGEPVWNLAIKGRIVDLRYTLTGAVHTNVLELGGAQEGSSFLVEIDPTAAEDNIHESIAWDSNVLRIIQRWSESGNRSGPRDSAIALVEPSIFSRYATHAAAGVLIALSDESQRRLLLSKRSPVILGHNRVYPEEENAYVVDERDNGFNIRAVTPGKRVVAAGVEELPEFINGFTRWTFDLNDMLQDGSIVRRFVYERFLPDRNTLKIYRRVSGELHLTRSQQSEKGLHRYTPAILEPKLPVKDFRGRHELFGVTTGRVDLFVDYVITNKVWEEDSDFIQSRVASMKEAFSQKPVDQSLIDSQLLKHHERRGVNWTYVGVIAMSGVVLFVCVYRSKSG